MFSETLIADYVAELVLDVAKEKYKNKIDKKKLKSEFASYIKRQSKYNELCFRTEEIDFQGLVDYIKENLLEDIEMHCFVPNKEKSERFKDYIISTATEYAHAETNEARVHN